MPGPRTAGLPRHVKARHRWSGTAGVARMVCRGPAGEDCLVALGASWRGRRGTSRQHKVVEARFGRLVEFRFGIASQARRRGFCPVQASRVRAPKAWQAWIDRTP
jgi:hypothetical protein